MSIFKGPEEASFWFSCSAKDIKGKIILEKSSIDTIHNVGRLVFQSGQVTVDYATCSTLELSGIASRSN